MLWRCECCGAEFDQPYYNRYRDCLDGENGWETRCELLCPDCASDEIEEIFESESEEINDGSEEE